MSLLNLRRKIDSLDKKIVELLNERAKRTKGIFSLKRRFGKSLYSPERESEVLRKILKLNKGPLNSEALKSIYREVMSYSLSLGGPLKIAYLGPQATFTNLAAIKRFGSQVKYVPCDNIADVFLEVERGTADYGVVPVENSVEGAVNHTLDMLVDSDLKICAQVILDISHNLLSCCPRNKIKKIYSISQVFGQCRIWLQRNLPVAENIEVSSTTRAAQIAASEKNSAAIASSLAAEIYGLKLIAAHIEDSPHNVTRFLVIGKTDVQKTGHDRTSIMFSIKDKVGALHDMLIAFKKNKINLTKIESRPSKKRAWDYYFFLDLKGHRDDSNVKRALRVLENNAKFLKVLGSYPVSE